MDAHVILVDGRLSFDVTFPSLQHCVGVIILGYWAAYSWMPLLPPQRILSGQLGVEGCREEAALLFDQFERAQVLFLESRVGILSFNKVLKTVRRHTLVIYRQLACLIVMMRFQAFEGERRLGVRPEGL